MGNEKAESFHQEGYGLVLAKVSVIWKVPWDIGGLFGIVFAGKKPLDAIATGTVGSTCTMWEQDCVIVRIKAVFPTPKKTRFISECYILGAEDHAIPDLPATSSLSRPRPFPASVKGLRLGTLMVGMMNC